MDGIGCIEIENWLYRYRKKTQQERSFLGWNFNSAYSQFLYFLRVYTAGHYVTQYRENF